MIEIMHRMDVKEEFSWDMPNLNIHRSKTKSFGIKFVVVYSNINFVCLYQFTFALGLVKI